LRRHSFAASPSLLPMSPDRHQPESDRSSEGTLRNKDEEYNLPPFQCSAIRALVQDFGSVTVADSRGASMPISIPRAEGHLEHRLHIRRVSIHHLLHCLHRVLSLVQMGSLPGDRRLPAEPNFGRLLVHCVDDINVASLPDRESSKLRRPCFHHRQLHDVVVLGWHGT
jgi:hypothetical protein